MARRAYAYSITLAQVGPVHDPDFVAAGPRVRADVLGWILAYGLKEKDADLAAGLDKDGVALAPVSPLTRKYRRSAMGPADPDAPALMPAYAVSRTRLLLTGDVTRDRVVFTWEYDPVTAGPWGKILDYQRKGVGRRKVKRDVIGISHAALERVRGQVLARWTAWKLAGLAGPAPARQAPAAVPVPRIRVIGRVDVEQFTYGIGGSGSESTRKALAAGYSTGFFSRKPGQGLTAFGGPYTPPRPPAPPAAPAPITRPTPGPVFRPDARAGRGVYATVEVSASAIDRAWKRHAGFHVPRGGREDDPHKYANAAAFVRKAVAEGTPIDQPIITVDAKGVVSFQDGRHRFAALRDMGIQTVKVSAPRGDAARLKRLSASGGDLKPARVRKPRPEGAEDVQFVRAPAGGATSDVDGKFYKGGQLMPVHGLSPKREPKPADGSGVGGGPVKANEDGPKRSPRPARPPLTPDELRERDELREAWAEVRSGPLGELYRLGDFPHAIDRRVDAKRWAEWVESTGGAVLEAAIAGATAILMRRLAADPRRPADMTEADIRELVAYGLSEQADHPQNPLPKKHRKAFPLSAAANAAINESVQGAPADTFRDLLALARAMGGPRPRKDD